MGYADQTTVSSENSRAEIERTISRYGATGFGYAWDGERAAVTFTMEDRQVRFTISLPDRSQFKRTPTGRARVSNQVEKAYEQAVRQRWRALALVVKAKLEGVEAGIFTFEQEFLAHIVLPGGNTVYSHIEKSVKEAYELGVIPDMMPMLGTGSS